MTGWIARLFKRPGRESGRPASGNGTMPEPRQAGADREFRSGLEHFHAARYDEAATCFESALEQCHDFVEAHYQLGLVRLRQGLFEEACDSFTLALCFAPRMAGAHFGLACAQSERGERTEALISVERAIEAGEGGPEIYKLRGDLLYEAGNVPDAVASYRRAVALNPADASAHASLGYLLFVECADYESGVLHLEKAYELDPDEETAACNYTLVLLMHRGDLEGAVAHCDRLLAAQPEMHEARLNKAIALLMMGRFDIAWDDYEARKHARGYARSRLSIPEWDGRDPAGRTILVESEQGLGDEIMFASCFPELTRRGARCVIECSPRLASLFARSFPEARVIPAAKGEDRTAAALASAPDFKVAAGSLPRYFRRTPEQFPAHRGYLCPDEAMQAAWRQRLEALGPGPKIGLSWRGGIVSTRQALRSMPLRALRPLFALGECHWIDLQYGDTAAERADFQSATGGVLHHWEEAIQDLDQCAALVSNLDVVVTVCTMVAHLAGALGRPAWIMVPRIPEWRYLAQGERMPWYPSATLIRQRTAGDWSEVMDRVARCVRQVAQASAGEGMA